MVNFEVVHISEFLAELTAHASTRGREQSAQDVMATAMAECGLSVDRELCNITLTCGVLVW